ncbi:MAG: hypothetical protein J0L85_07375 [Zoogloea sp.]|nr:hypothetical protein [Zoogloea sp.]MCA0187493.1 hypothetical protein [Pseudomonadota bacterium]
MKPLVEMRLAGQIPPGDVWILFGDYEQVAWWQWSDVSAEIVMDDRSPIGRLDLRALVGLSVCIQADRYGDALMLLCRRLQALVRSLNVYVIEWLPDGIGMWWDRGMGESWAPFDAVERRTV